MTFWELLGYLGTACFFTRMLLQWLRSEREGRSVVPRGFWILSLAGALLLGSYAVQQRNWILATGFAVTGLLYVRNLWLQSGRRPVPTWVATVVGVAAGALLAWSATRGETHDLPRALVVLAACGQAVWSTRFVLQWWNAERTGKSELTALFWWWSLCGNTVLLAYTLALGNPVFVLGFLLGPFTQVRNLILLYRGGRARRASAGAQPTNG